ncbi:MAG: DUF2971 domain-containing protein [Pseudomonadota bacterium]
MSILNGKEIWMRKINCMNDYMEVDHGLSCIKNVFHSELGGSLRSLIDKIHHDLFGEINEMFSSWVESMKYDTFITCLSEHLDHEDTLGRLSMWRAYGYPNGVAIVLKGDPLFTPEDEIRAMSAPVAYLHHDGVMEEFEQIRRNISENSEELSKRNRDEIKNRFFNTLYFAALATKHPGFEEEREWRITYTPRMYPSKIIKKSVVEIHGCPQIVQKIPLVDNPEHKIDYVDLSKILDRVIVGPSNNAWEIREALVDLMQDNDYTDPSDKVIVSNIPLR